MQPAIRGNVVGFPTERTSHPVRDGATFWDIQRTRIRMAFGRLLNKVGVPAVIQPMEYDDKIANRHLAVSVDDLFVRISIDGRDYYFDRVSGRFDGTGESAN